MMPSSPPSYGSRLGFAACLLAGSAALAADPAEGFRLDASAAKFEWRQPAPPTGDAPRAGDGDVSSGGPASGDLGERASQAAPKLDYGAPRSRWWTIGAAVADNFQNAVDTNIHGAYSYFLAQDVEWSLELAAWHFNQPGDNPFGGSASMIFRWHFVNTGTWTVYADAGIGLLLASDDVPPDGTSFDFLPQVGVGVTRKLNDDGVRLQLGVNWHHISNARITSDDDNPGRDALMAYAGLIFPF